MSNQNVKKWYLSKTIQGQIVTLLGLLVTWFKLPVAQEEVAAIVGAVFTLIGLAYSIYGRVVTKGEKLVK